ncbi:MAG: hypothetical protein KF721_15080 [Ignavibacteriaceae bacterium]|nr:hypothetical protein [Ignavibacteriaceae bacterium]
MNKQRFAIPNNLNLEKLLQDKYPHYSAHLYKFYYLVDHLLENRFLNHKYSQMPKAIKNASKKRMIPLNSQILKKILVDRYYRDILDILLAEEIIETDNQYKKKIKPDDVAKSKAYSLMQKYINASFHYVPCTSKLFLDKLEKRKQKEIDNLAPHHNAIREMLKVINFDITAAEKQFTRDQNVLTSSQLNSLRMSLDKLLAQDYYFSVDKKSNRLYHNYDQIRREYRKFILDKNNCRMIEVDISNSQPFFLALLFKELADDNELVNDVLHYFELTANAKFYDYVKDRVAKISKVDIIQFFYCETRHEKKRLKLFFIEQFPICYELITEMKKNNHADIANELMKLEADMMINTIAPILLEKNIQFVPVHDSVMISPKYKNVVINIIRKEFFKKYNMNPPLKVK